MNLWLMGNTLLMGSTLLAKYSLKMFAFVLMSVTQVLSTKRGEIFLL